MELNDLNRAFGNDGRNHEIMIQYHGRKIKVAGGFGGAGVLSRDTNIEAKPQPTPKKSDDFFQQNQMLSSFLCLM